MLFNYYVEDVEGSCGMHVCMLFVTAKYCTHCLN